jgi:hypothetical protein
MTDGTDTLHIVAISLHAVMNNETIKLLLQLYVISCSTLLNDGPLILEV